MVGHWIIDKIESSTLIEIQKCIWINDQLCRMSGCARPTHPWWKSFERVPGIREGVRKRGAGMVPFVNPFLTYIGGFLLSKLKFFLGILKSLWVLVQLILSSLQLLLQSYQIVLKLRRVSVRTVSEGDQQGEGVAWARTGARARRTGEKKRGQEKEKS